MPIELYTHNVNSDLTSAGKENSHGTYHFYFEAIHDEDASALRDRFSYAMEYGGASFPISPATEGCASGFEFRPKKVDMSTRTTGDVSG